MTTTGTQHTERSLITGDDSLEELADLKSAVDQQATPNQIHSKSLHSLRNKLAIIIGHCDLLKERLKVDSQSTEHLDAIKALAYGIAKTYSNLC